jgi:hypothetical protein
MITGDFLFEIRKLRELSSQKDERQILISIFFHVMGG